jgi:hypothetical protein
MRRLLFSTVLALSLLAAPLLAAPAAFADMSTVTFDPRVVSFGHVSVGGTMETAVTLTNTSGQSLEVNGYEVSSGGPSFNGNFTLNPGNCTLFTTLAPGEDCTFAIMTSPKVAGPLHGQFCYTVVGPATYERECGRLVGAAT